MAWKVFQRGKPSETALFLSHLPQKIKTRLRGKRLRRGRKEVMVLKTNSLEATDIFRGAFYLCRGAEPSGIRFRNNGRRIATFMITGKGLDKLDRDYRSGQAMVNPLQFRESLNHLRDILFEKLREQDEGERYDRERDNRYHQKHR